MGPMETSRDDSGRACGNPACANTLEQRGGGRRREYCSRSCQQAAYRAREEESAAAELAAVREHAERLAARVVELEAALQASRDESESDAASQLRAERIANDTLRRRLREATER